MCIFVTNSTFPVNILEKIFSFLIDHACCLNSVHSAADVRNSPLSLEGGISILVSIVNTYFICSITIYCNIFLNTGLEIKKYLIFNYELILKKMKCFMLPVNKF